MSSTKLLLITSEFPPQPGGIGTHAYHLAKELSRGQMEVTVVTDQRSTDGIEEKQFDNSLSFSVHRIRRKKIIAFSYLERLSTAMRLARQYDVVLLSGKFSIWTGGIMSMLTNSRLLGVIHGSELLLSNGILRSYTNWCLKRLGHVIAVSNFTLSLIATLDLKNTTVIPNGFAISEQTHFNKKIAKELSLITVGNVTQRKGQHNVVKALPLLKETHPNVKYHIVGIPTNQLEIEALAKQLDVEENIVFHGRVTDELKISLLKEASIFIMLSENTEAGDVEGFGIAILEANALGIPAIGAANCGIEDAILDGKSGKLIPTNQPIACKEAVDAILSNYPYFSQQARTWTDQFHWSVISKEYLKLIIAHEN